MIHHVPLLFVPLQKALKNYALVFDAVYTPKLTRLLKEAQESGASIVYGTEMLVNQAFRQYEQFTGLPGRNDNRIPASLYAIHFKFLRKGKQE